MLKEKLLEDLKVSMRDKNVVRKNTVQMVRAAILQIEKDTGSVVDDAKIVDIIAKEIYIIFNFIVINWFKLIKIESL